MGIRVQPERSRFARATLLRPICSIDARRSIRSHTSSAIWKGPASSRSMRRGALARPLS